MGAVRDENGQEKSWTGPVKAGLKLMWPMLSHWALWASRSLATASRISMGGKPVG